VIKEPAFSQLQIPAHLSGSNGSPSPYWDRRNAATISPRLGIARARSENLSTALRRDAIWPPAICAIPADET
jgi:hypothetical protein